MVSLCDGSTRPMSLPPRLNLSSGTLKYVVRIFIRPCRQYRFQVTEKINDAYFAKAVKKGSRSAEEEFFEDGKPKAKEALPESRTTDQKTVDQAVLAAVKKTENLVKYLKASWGLSKGQFPHQLVF